MSTTKRTPRAPQGIRARHAQTCRSRADGRCNCRPSYEAFVYLKREGCKVRKTFPALAAAKAWRADAITAANRGKLRAPVATTLREVAAELLAGAEQGSIPNRSGGRYKPATLRSYRRALDERILPVLGGQRLTEIQRRDVQDLADELTAQLAASTVQNTLDPLRVIYRRAMRRDLVSVDPTEGLELRRPKGQRDRIASPAEAWPRRARPLPGPVPAELDQTDDRDAEQRKAAEEREEHDQVGGPRRVLIVPDSDDNLDDVRDAAGRHHQEADDHAEGVDPARLRALLEA